MASYIPAKDSQFSTWLANFSTLITASPATYGLVASDASAIAAQNTAWAAAYALVTSPSTKTPTTVAAKDTARVNALGVVRPYAIRISRNMGISSGTKIALGINPGPGTNPPAPIPAPTTYPVLSVPNSLPLGHVLTYRDQLASPSVKSKPPGAVYCEVHAIAGTATPPTTTPDQWQVVASQTKTPFIINWYFETPGKYIYYAARWVTKKGLKGAFGTTVSKVLTN